MSTQTSQRQLDMLHGPIWNKIPQFALPVAATAILEQLFNASDVAVVGNFTGAESTLAVAAVGSNSSIISLIVNLFIGIALGSNVVIAHAIGHGDKASVHKAVHTSIVAAVLGGAAVTIIGELIAAPLLGLLHVPDEVFPLALLYLRIYLLGMPVILLYNFEAAIFRSVGETKIPLLALAASGVLNVILNLFFVIVLHMTVNGVATATVISNAVSSLILYQRLRTTTLEIRVEPRSLRIDPTSLRRILQIGLPAGIQSAVFSVANIVIQSAINSLGTIVMAASSAAYNIEVFTYDILNSFSQACTTFVGQNYGAGKLDRVKKGVNQTLLMSGASTIVISVLFCVFGRYAYLLFTTDEAVIDIGMQILLFIVPTYITYIAIEILSGAIRGAGKAFIPTVICITGVCLLRIIWLEVAVPIYRSIYTVCAAYPVTWTVTSLLFLIYYKKGAWLEDRHHELKLKWLQLKHHRN